MVQAQYLKSVLFIFVLLNLSACNALMPKSSYGKQELDSILDSQRMADTAYQQGNWQQAIKHYNDLIAVYPDNSIAWYRVGNSHAELNQHDQAVKAYQKSVELDPNNTKAWHNLGVLQLRMATQTFLNMQEHATETDEYAKRGRFVVNSVGEILQQGFGVNLQSTTENE